jgi:hypothetical protein
MKHPRLTIGLGALGAVTLGLLLTREADRPLPIIDPLSVPPGTGPVRLTSHLSDAFFAGVLVLEADYQAKGARVTAEDFLAVLNAESGIDPQALNKDSHCAGMNQICVLGNNPNQKGKDGKPLVGVGWTDTTAAYLALPAEQQLVYVRRFFDGVINGRYNLLTDMGKLYLLNFNPGNLGQPDSKILYRASDGPCSLTDRRGCEYWQNQRSLDPEKKGYIEVADMARFVKRSLASNGPLYKQFPSKGLAYWAELRMRLNQARARTRPLVSGGGCASCATSRFGCGAQGCART